MITKKAGATTPTEINETDTLTVSCRSTGCGAQTTMWGEKLTSSRSGNHWEERLQVQINDVIPVLNITNSGKCKCYTIRIVSVHPLVYEQDQSEKKNGICEICGG
jgi:hypothetical protein